MSDYPLWTVALWAGPSLPWVLFGLSAGLFVVALLPARRRP